MERQRKEFYDTLKFDYLLQDTQLCEYEKAKLFYEFKTTLHFYSMFESSLEGIEQKVVKQLEQIVPPPKQKNINTIKQDL